MRYAALLAAGFVLGATGGTARATPTGWVDDVDPSGVHGWAAEPGDASTLTVDIQVMALGADGSTGAVVASATVTADQPRPDVPAADPCIVGADHGYSWPFDPAPGAYLVRVTATSSAGTQALLPGDVRIARAITAAPRTDLWLRYRGLVDGLQRPGDYESYPTAMLDGSTYKMWFAGGPGDKIYYASGTGPYSGWSVYGPYVPVVSESSCGPDSGLTADPSVVKVPFPDPSVPYRYFMYYTAAPTTAGSYNQIFGALSTDGVSWTKMDAATHTFGTAYPVVGPAVSPTSEYGAGQASMLWLDQTFTSSTPSWGFVMYFTDTTAGGPCLGVSTDGGWTFPRIASPLPAFGDYTWDMKYLAATHRTLAMLALPGDLGSDGRRHGAVGAAVSADGIHFTPEVRVPMVQLTTDTLHQCINNGGLLGDPTGVVTGDTTAFYFGDGWGMQSETVGGVWAPDDWDIGAVEVHVEDCGPGVGTSPCAWPAPDAGMPDAGIPDAGTAGDTSPAGGPDAGRTVGAEGDAGPNVHAGCGCAVGGAGGGSGGLATLATLTALAIAFRRARWGCRRAACSRSLRPS